MLGAQLPQRTAIDRCACNHYIDEVARQVEQLLVVHLAQTAPGPLEDIDQRLASPGHCHDVARPELLPWIALVDQATTAHPVDGKPFATRGPFERAYATPHPRRSGINRVRTQLELTPHRQSNQLAPLHLLLE